MQHIKLFLASSILEFRDVRKELGDFIRSLNNIFVEREIYIELVVCEDISNDINEGRKQEQYNRIIEQSHFFYMLVGRSIGQHTLEEFEVALRHFKKYGNPKIYTYFVRYRDNVGVENRAVVNLKNRLEDNIGHYYNTCDSVDTIKLNFLMELTKIVHIQNDKQYMCYLKNAGDSLLMGRMSSTYPTNSNRIYLNSELSAIEMKAIKKIGEGNIKEAQIVLRSPQRKERIKQIDESMKLEKKEIKKYISEKVLLIELLSLEKVNEHTIREILEIYNDISNLVIKYGVFNSVLYSYTIFLYENHYYSESLIYIKKFWELEQYNEFCNKSEKGMIWNLFGLLYWENMQYDEAKKAFEKGISYFDEVIDNKENKLYYCSCYSHYALLLSDMYLPQKAIDIYKKLIDKFDGQFEDSVELKCVYAEMLHNYACALIDNDRNLEVAEELLEKSLKTYREISDNQNKDIKRILPIVYNTLAILCGKKNNKEKTLCFLQKAIRICQELCGSCFYLYAEELAISYHNYAMELVEIDFDEAKLYFEKAISIWGILVPNNHRAYDIKIAEEFYNYASSLMKQGQVSAAIDVCLKSEKVYLEQLDGKEIIYKIKYSRVCTCLASLFDEIGDKIRAKKYYLKAFRMYRKLSQEQLKTCEIDYALLCMKMGGYMMENDDNPFAIKKILREAHDVLKKYPNYEEYDKAVNKALNVYC